MICSASTVQAYCPNKGSMAIAAHQPNFLPNLAFFSKMKQADRFVVITNVQFEKHEGWQQRHKIKGPNGDIWLTVPVFGSQNQLIKDVYINNQVSWQKKHIRTLQFLYAKGKGREYLEPITQIYEKQWEKLSDLNIEFIQLLKEILEIETDLAIDDDISGKKHTLLINICKKHNGDTYLSGIGAKNYLTEERLEEITRSELSHEYVPQNLTTQYPYSTLHYLLQEGDTWVKNVI